jgi:short-subunit dehydrogenase
LTRFDIHVLLVVPGVTKTGLWGSLLARKARMEMPVDRGVSPEEVARRTIDALERNQNEVWIEKEARRLLWVNWLAPRFVDRRMAAVVRKLYAPEIEENARRREEATRS